MKIVDATYRTILNRLTLQSCQLCDVARDFRYDPRILTKLTKQINKQTNKLTNKQTNELTLWSRVLPEKLTGPQLVKKFPTIYGTQRFIVALTSAHYMSLS